jgi:glycosyltransferase involved in cell wall biosynthesis
MAQKILYLVSEDWYFVSHRLPMARAARAAGYEVHVATHIGDCAGQIESEGFHLHPIEWRRGSLNPFGFLAGIAETRRLYRRVQPDLVHHVAFQTIVIGSVAALGLPMSKLNAFTGLGFAFTSTNAKARLLRLLAGGFLGWLLKRSKSTVLVQNPEDRSVIVKLGVPQDRIATIAGSGVDVEAFAPLPVPADAIVTAGFVGRLLDHKGVRALVRAHEILRARGASIRILLAGAPDAHNPASIPKPLLDAWRKIPNLVMLGHVEDVRNVWRQVDIAVLPSRGGEGIPMSLLEAAACGRPLIATDVPGCREIARQGVNALLVPPNDPTSLADAIETLANDPPMRLRFGRASRQLVIDEYSSVRIGQEIVALYAHLLGDRPQGRTGRT